MSENTCADCEKQGEELCSACKLFSYYCKDKKKKKRRRCRNGYKSCDDPYNITNTEEGGRCLVASRDIKPGEHIIMESPIVYGPDIRGKEGATVLCVGCCRFVLGEESHRCPGCDFPVCSPDCPGLQALEGHAYECPILSLQKETATDGLHDFYRQITLLTLRMLLLQRKQPRKYSEMMKLDAHRGPETEIDKLVQERTFKYLDNSLLTPLKILQTSRGKTVLDDMSKETIHKICGIINVNAWDVHDGSQVSVLYPTACLMEHSCTSNTASLFHTAEHGYDIVVSAAVPIQKGDRITTMFTHADWGTQARREHLKKTKDINCKCKRCSDPTELGTYFSALKCRGAEPDSCNGYQLPVDPLDDNTEWVCSHCESKLSNSDVARLIDPLKEEVNKVQLSRTRTVEELDNLLTKLLTFLHPNHFHIFTVKHLLVTLVDGQLRETYDTYNCIRDDTVMRQITLCNELLEICKKIDPGNARLKYIIGTTHQSLGQAKMILIKRKYDLGIKSNDASVMAMIKECDESLEMASDRFRYEFFGRDGYPSELDILRDQFRELVKNDNVELIEDRYLQLLIKRGHDYLLSKLHKGG